MTTRFLNLPEDGSYVEAVGDDAQFFIVDNQNSFHVQFTYADATPGKDAPHHFLKPGEVKATRMGSGKIFVALPEYLVDSPSASLGRLTVTD